MKATKPTKKPQPAEPDQPVTAQRACNFTANAVIDLDAAAAGEGGPALPRFRMVAYTGGPMRVAGWRYPVVVDLAGLAIPSQSRPIRFGHDPLSGVGHTDAIRVEQGQLDGHRRRLARHAGRARSRRQFQERLSLAGLGRRQRRGVRVRQGTPDR